MHARRNIFGKAILKSAHGTANKHALVAHCVHRDSVTVGAQSSFAIIGETITVWAGLVGFFRWRLVWFEWLMYLKGFHSICVPSRVYYHVCASVFLHVTYSLNGSKCGIKKQLIDQSPRSIARGAICDRECLYDIYATVFVVHIDESVVFVLWAHCIQ